MTTPTTLTPDHWRVLALLHAFEQAKAKTAFPSLHRLAADLHCSIRTVQRRLSDLEAIQYLARVPRYGANGRQTSNIYRLASHVFRCKGTRTGGHPITASPSAGAEVSHPTNDGGGDVTTTSAHSTHELTGHAVTPGRPIPARQGDGGSADNTTPYRTDVKDCTCVTPVTEPKTKEGREPIAALRSPPTQVVGAADGNEKQDDRSTDLDRDLDEALTRAKVAAVGEWIAGLTTWVDRLGEKTVASAIRDQGMRYAGCWWRIAESRLVDHLRGIEERISIIKAAQEAKQAAHQRGVDANDLMQLGLDPQALDPAIKQTILANRTRLYSPVQVIAHSWYAQRALMDGTSCPDLFPTFLMGHLASKATVIKEGAATIVAVPVGYLRSVTEALANSATITVVPDHRPMAEAVLSDEEARSFVYTINDQEKATMMMSGVVQPSVVNKLRQWVRMGSRAA